MFGPEVICPQCSKPFRRGKHNQRFCRPQCKDDFHNAEKMIAYRLWRAEVEEERRQARLEVVNGDVPHTPLREIIQVMTKPEPSLKRRAW